MKWKQSTPISVIITLTACGVSAQITFSGKLEEQITCDVSSTSNAQWNENLDNGTSIPLFQFEDGQVTPIKPQLSKYDDFSATVESNKFILIITTVEKNDGGTYACVRFGGSTLLFDLVVEALPDSFDLSCRNSPSRTCGGPEEVLASSVDCTCTATEVSPRSLQLQWSISPSNVLRNETLVAGAYFNLTSEVALTPTSTDKNVTCSLTGYQSDGIDSSMIMRSYNFVSPTCTLEVIRYDVMCTTAELNCSCSGGMPDAYTYSFFHGNESRIGDFETPDIEVDIVVDETFTFYCRGCNGIYGETSLDEKADILCELATTTPTMTLMATSPPESDNLGLIIGVVIAAVVVGGGAIGFSVYWFGIRTSSRKRSVTGSNNDNTDGNGVNSKLQSEPDRVEYAAVNKPESDPQPAPRSSKPPGNNTEPEKMELQYADIDHSNRGRSNEIHQPADAPTEYATVQSVIV